MRWHIAIALPCLLLASGCGMKDFDDSTYVLVRNSAFNSSTPGLRAYFVGEGAQLNGTSCRELLGLANEAVETRIARGETNLVKYECVSLAEARERGFK